MSSHSLQSVIGVDSTQRSVLRPLNPASNPSSSTSFASKSCRRRIPPGTALLKQMKRS